MKNKKGQALDALGKLAIGVVVLAVALVVGFLIISQVQTQIIALDTDFNISDTSTYDAGYNATVTLEAAVATVPDWVPIVIITSIGAIMLGLIAMFRRKS